MCYQAIKTMPITENSMEGTVLLSPHPHYDGLLLLCELQFFYEVLDSTFYSVAPNSPPISFTDETHRLSLPLVTQILNPDMFKGIRCRNQKPLLDQEQEAPILEASYHRSPYRMKNRRHRYRNGTMVVSEYVDTRVGLTVDEECKWCWSNKAVVDVETSMQPPQKCLDFKGQSVKPIVPRMIFLGLAVL